MDPYLEHPALWPDVHNSLIAALRDSLAPRVAPRYFIALERRAYMLAPHDLDFIGRPDLAVVPAATRGMEGTPPAGSTIPGGHAAVLDVDVPLVDEVVENYLEVRDVATGRLVTILELLSPANKLFGAGRREYETKRESVFRTWTNLVEVDLLRAGEPMPVIGPRVQSDYRILVFRGRGRHPRAKLYVFDVRDPIPRFPLPLQPDDAEPEVDIGGVLHGVYARARFDLRLDYSQPPVPPLTAEQAAWADALPRAATE